MLDGHELPLVAMQCPPSVDFSGSQSVDFVCEWYAPTLSTAGADYHLHETSGGVRVNDALSLSGEVVFGEASDDDISTPAASVVFTASRGEALPGQWRYTSSAPNAVFPTLRGNAESLDGTPVTVVVHPSTGAVDFTDSQVAESTDTTTVAGDLSNASVTSTLSDQVFSAVSTQKTAILSEGVLVDGLSVTEVSAALDLTEVTIEEIAGSCGCVDTEEVVWEGLAGWGVAGGIAAADTVGEWMPGVLVDPIPGEGDHIPGSIFVHPPAHRAPAGGDTNVAIGTAPGLGDPLGGMLVEPIPESVTTCPIASCHRAQRNP